MQDYLQKLKQLGPKNRKSVLTYIIRRAAQVIRRQMARGIKVRSSILRNSIRVRIKHYPKDGSVVAIVGVESEKKTVKVKTLVTPPGKKRGTSRVLVKHASGYNQWGMRQVAMNYGRLVDKGRKAFTQRFNTIIGKKYYVKGHRGLWTATRVMRITRHIGAAPAQNFVEKSIEGVQERMRASMIRALDTWLEKHGY